MLQWLNHQIQSFGRYVHWFLYLLIHVIYLMRPNSNNNVITACLLNTMLLWYFSVFIHFKIRCFRSSTDSPKMACYVFQCSYCFRSSNNSPMRKPALATSWQVLQQADGTKGRQNQRQRSDRGVCWHSVRTSVTAQKMWGNFCAPLRKSTENEVLSCSTDNIDAFMTTTTKN